MAVEQSFQEPQQDFESNGDIKHKKWSPLSHSTTSPENANECFDCNICLDSAQDPVVTLCGHLYCWPCIYKWLCVQSSSTEPDQRQLNCPVCKADIIESSLVPLYGRGISYSDSEGNKKTHLDLVIPRRPPPIRLNPSITSSRTSTLYPNQYHLENLFQSRPQMFPSEQFFSNPFGYQTTTQPSSLGGIATTNIINPTIGMFGEMVFGRSFGSSNTSVFAYPNTYSVIGSGRHRMRRQEMQFDKSLSRVSVFLFCCVILCLLMF